MCHQSKSLYCRDLLAHFGCVNALEFSDDGSLFVTGSDDMRVLLWPISEALTSRETPSPFLMEAEHSSNIFCLAVNPDNSRIYSGFCLLLLLFGFVMESRINQPDCGCCYSLCFHYFYRNKQV